MISLMVLGYVVIFILLLWRVVALPKQGSVHSLGILRAYALPLVVAVIVAVALAIPFLSGYPEGIGFPVNFRRAYILAAHVTYGTAAAALFYLFVTSQRRMETAQIKWSLIAIFALATLVLTTFIFGALYDKAFFGFYFDWDRPHSARFILFLACILSFLFAFLRTFRYRSGSATATYWAEPLVLAVGIAAKIVAAVFPGENWDALTWL